MKTSSSIPIKNIYYMLAYAYQTLTLSEYQRIDVESFNHVEDLYSEILLVGLPTLIRNGLQKDYISITDQNIVVKGKIDMNSSIKRNTLANKKLVVTYDEFSEDILLNQILKATLSYLCRLSTISKEKRKKFLSLLVYFSHVSDIELTINLWTKIKYNRQNIRYQFLIDICRFLYENLLFSKGNEFKHMSIIDNQKLATLFEKFVYAFYKRETSYTVTHPQIYWHTDNDFSEALPIMQTDIVLQYHNKTLIIDTKFYAKNMLKRFENSQAKQHASNLYQLFTYMHNWRKQPEEQVSGMLLYARTTADEQPDHHYQIKGNQLSVVTINLNQNFSDIKKDLLKLVELVFN